MFSWQPPKLKPFLRLASITIIEIFLITNFPIPVSTDFDIIRSLVGSEEAATRQLIAVSIHKAPASSFCLSPPLRMGKFGKGKVSKRIAKKKKLYSAEEVNRMQSAVLIDEFLGTGKQYMKVISKKPEFAGAAIKALDESASHFSWGIMDINISLEALREKIRLIDEYISKSLGEPDTTTVEGIERVIEMVIGRLPEGKGFFLKEDKLKTLLYEHPPVKLLEEKGLSLNDLIEKYGIYEIFSVVRFTESPEYLNRLMDIYQTLKPEDFEIRRLRICVFPRERYPCALRALDKKLTVSNDKLAGTIIAVPYDSSYDKHYGARVLRILMRTAHYYHEVMSYSAFYRLLLKEHENFGKRIKHAMQGYSYLYGDNLSLKSSMVPFFHPHHMLEIMSWEFSIEFLFNLANEISGLSELLEQFKNTFNALGFLSRGQSEKLASLSLLDIVSMTSKPTETNYLVRETIRKAIFVRLIGKEWDAEWLVISNIDKLDILDLMPAEPPPAQIISDTQETAVWVKKWTIMMAAQRALGKLMDMYPDVKLWLVEMLGDWRDSKHPRLNVYMIGPWKYGLPDDNEYSRLKKQLRKFINEELNMQNIYVKLRVELIVVVSEFSSKVFNISLLRNTT